PSCSPARNASTSLRPSIICSNCVFMYLPYLSKILSARFFSALRSAIDKFSFSFFGKNRDQKNREPLVAPDIHNPRPAALPHSFATPPDLPKPARPANHVPTLWVGCNECHDIRRLVLAKEFVGNGEVRRRLDNRLHNFSCSPLDTISQRELCAIGH